MPRVIHRHVGLGLVVIGLALTLLSGCAPEGRRSSGRGLLVIALDGLRADRVSALGYDRQTTPYLDSLASDHAVLFDSVLAAAPQLVPAHAAWERRTGGAPHRVGRHKACVTAGGAHADAECVAADEARDLALLRLRALFAQLTGAPPAAVDSAPGAAPGSASGSASGSVPLFASSWPPTMQCEPFARFQHTEVMRLLIG